MQNNQLSENCQSTTEACKDKLNLLDKELLSSCIHCGLCLPACPTYLATGREQESPRGRIYLLSLWQEKEFELTSEIAQHIDSCLGCMGCQTACPSGVNYEEILAQVKPLILPFQNKRKRRLMRFVFKQILPNYKRLHQLGKFLQIYQSSRINKLLPNLPIPEKLKRRLIEWEKFLPQVPGYTPLPKQSWLSGKKIGEVQFFAGCVMDVFYNHVNHASLRLLTKQGNIVKLPEQTCCGALAQHAGEVDIAQELAKKNISSFENTKGSIIVSSAGCAAMLKEYKRLLINDPQWKERAEDFSNRVQDITEYLASGQFNSKPKEINKTVAYHAACHLTNVQKIPKAPLSLLESIPGLTLIPLTDHEHCCGSAGIYNILQTELSLKILERKMQNIKLTGAEILVTTNPGCLLQLESGLKEHNINMKIYHLIELLDQAYN